MDVGSIPWTAIHHYMMSEQYDLEEQEMFLACILSMDQAYLKKMSKK